MHHERALEVLETKFTEKQLRRLIESAEVVVLKTGDSVVVEYGFYVFAGQGECGN